MKTALTTATIALALASFTTLAQAERSTPPVKTIAAVKAAVAPTTTATAPRIQGYARVLADQRTSSLNSRR